MFKLVAMIFVVVNGVPSKQPSAAFAYQETFKTEKECEDFFKTPNGKAANKALTDATKKRSLVVRFGCVKSKPEEDNTI